MPLNAQALDKKADKAPKTEAPKAEAPKVQTKTASDVSSEAANLPQVDPEIVESQADFLAITDLLVDPSDIDRTYKQEGTDEDSKTDVKNRARIIGYRVKNVSEDTVIDINEYGLGDDWQRNGERLNRGADRGIYKLKPNESRDLTIAELAVLLARPEFNRYARGGKYPIRANYGTKNGRNSDATTGSDQGITFRTNPIEGDGGRFTLSDMPMIDILKAEWSENPSGQRRVTKRTILPGFDDKFAPAARSAKNTRSRGNRSQAETKRVYDINAQLFLQQVAKSK